MHENGRQAIHHEAGDSDMIHAGELNKLVTLQAPEQIRDSYGEEIITWQNVTTIWAKIQPLTGRELYAAQQLHAESKVKIVIRYRSDMDTTKRLYYANRYFEILYIANYDESNIELAILAKEVV